MSEHFQIGQKMEIPGEDIGKTNLVNRNMLVMMLI
jgi:hypothetical protein